MFEKSRRRLASFWNDVLQRISRIQVVAVVFSVFLVVSVVLGLTMWSVDVGECLKSGFCE